METAAPDLDAGRSVDAGMVLGLDEAGRGSVLGPLVIGGFLAHESALPRLPELGVQDSKLIGPPKRKAVFSRLDLAGKRLSVELSPARVDTAVRQGRLNHLEAETFAEIIRQCRPEIAYVDACDPVAARFGRYVSARARNGTRVVARHHADRDLPVVGAASIVAKVLRDRAIARLATSISAEIGTGYPSDPRTIAYLKEAFAGPDRGASWIRHSWATSVRLKPAIPVQSLDRFLPEG